MRVIQDPFITGFEFVAGQLGSTEPQIAFFTRRPPITIMKSNQAIGSVLAFPYHGTRGTENPTIETMQKWWDEWGEVHSAHRTTTAVPLDLFRDMIDRFMKHTDSPEDNK